MKNKINQKQDHSLLSQLPILSGLSIILCLLLILFGALVLTHNELARKYLLLFIFSVLIFLTLNTLSKRSPKQLFIDPINNLLALLKNDMKHLKTENSNVTKEISELKDKIYFLSEEFKQKSQDAALSQIALQVVHDIRSPLMVLNIETEVLHQIPEAKRISIRNAIQRINDIANNLLTEYNQNLITAESRTKCTSELLLLLLESIISEKRTQISGLTILINLVTCTNSHLVFINVDGAAFKRVLSNIINNSIESIKQNGIIWIKLSNISGKIVIKIIDNGCGIPEQQLPFIIEPGCSFGKDKGSGLGLPYIVKQIHIWNGNYSIKSEVNQGTVFEIILPLAKPASWFSANVIVPRNGTIAIIDDDSYIHEIWATKFNSEFLSQNKINIIHLHTTIELENFCLNNNTQKTTFLLDYEFFNNMESGLSVANKHGITKNTTIVTNRYEDLDLRESCQTFGIKIIPKPYAKWIPVKVINPVDLIFIDDDEAITDIWKTRAEQSNVTIEVFNHIEEFLRVYKFYPTDTLIYIDSDLGGDLRGEDVAKELYDRDYKNLMITTGFEKEKFANMHWIKDIVDKFPPF